MQLFAIANACSGVREIFYVVNPLLLVRVVIRESFANPACCSSGKFSLLSSFFPKCNSCYQLDLVMCPIAVFIMCAGDEAEVVELTEITFQGVLIASDVP